MPGIAFKKMKINVCDYVLSSSIAYTFKYFGIVRRPYVILCHHKSKPFFSSFFIKGKAHCDLKSNEGKKTQMISSFSSERM